MKPWLLAATLALVAAPAGAKPAFLVGAWGGPHAAISFEGGLANVRFDCASGTIDVPVYPAKDGAFEARGTFRAGMPGPVRVGQIYRSQPATYSGIVTKQSMTLNIALEDGGIVGPFNLVQGAPPQITRCL